MIEVEHVTKRYGDRVALEDLSLSVSRGEIVALLGPNGAGKTTTMRILAGTLSASEGRVRIDGFDVLDQPREARRRVGYLPEHPPIHGALSVRACLAFSAELKGLGRAWRRAEIGRVVEATDLAAVLDRPAGQLSRGYKQRVGLAMALLGQPPVLILDEPTTGLDPLQIREMRALIRGLAGRSTVLLSTHLLPEAALTCSKALVLNRGRRVRLAPIEELLQGSTSGPRLALEDLASLEAVYAGLVDPATSVREG